MIHGLNKPYYCTDCEQWVTEAEVVEWHGRWRHKLTSIAQEEESWSKLGKATTEQSVSVEGKSARKKWTGGEGKMNKYNIKVTVESDEWTRTEKETFSSKEPILSDYNAAKIADEGCKMIIKKFDKKR